jgi:hypothetical protein
MGSHNMLLSHTTLEFQICKERSTVHRLNVVSSGVVRACDLGQNVAGGTSGWQ